MEVGLQQSRTGFGAFARKPVFVVSLLVVLSAAIIVSVHSVIDKAISNGVKGHAESSALSWASRFNATLTDQSSLVVNGELTDAQRQVTEASMLFGNAYSFTLYDMTGRTAYSSDYGVTEAKPDAPVDQVALQVVLTGQPDMTVIQRIGNSGETQVYVDAFVPVTRPDGAVLGAIRLYIDRSHISSLYRSFLDWIGYLLPAICAIIYAIPAAAFVLMRQKAYARQDDIRNLSMYDTLTGALNRHTMNVECEKLFAAKRTDSRIGVLFVDVDKFKNINDQYGHEFGDAYLKSVALRLKESVHESDWVARIGGDEFVVVCQHINAKILAARAEDILEASRKTFEYKGTSIQGSLSIGTHLAEPKATAAEAFHAADLALYHAKSHGRNRVEPYFPELDAALARRNAIEARLHRALENDGFEIYYQPLTNPADRSVIGFEALLRLDDDDEKPISPVEFIPIAEDAGIIHKLGLQTLRRAIAVAKTWPEYVFLSVNLSPAQFQCGDLDVQIEEVLSELDFPASRLELEVTESLLLGNEESIQSQLVGLKQQGMSIAMDDFGTGYSSLGYLWKYHFDKLKIDRVFLEGVEFAGDRYSEIIETIVTLGNKMGMQVTVEGVENENQRAILDQLSCDQYQGFLFGRPMPAEDTHQLFSTGFGSTSKSDSPGSLSKEG
ncbi:MAG: EAL domain-containing protein [Roseobacter sp.]